MKKNTNNSSKENLNKSSKNTAKKSSAKAKKVGWDTTSKIVFAVAVVILAVIIAFFVIRGKKDVITDKYGQTHVVVTNFWGEYVQDEYGNLFEKVTDENGKSITKSYIFPDRITNKNGKKIENAFIKLKIRKGWADMGVKDYMYIQHEGGCSAKDAQCEVKIDYDIMAGSDTLYTKEKNLALAYVEKIDVFSDLKEYETEVFGLKARAISYKQEQSDGSNGTWYYYLVEQGLAAFEIRAFAHDGCFTEAELIEEIEKSFTLKDLGGVRPEVPVTEAPTEEADGEETTDTTAEETSSTSAVSETSASAK